MGGQQTQKAVHFIQLELVAHQKDLHKTVQSEPIHGIEAVGSIDIALSSHLLDIGCIKLESPQWCRGPTALYVLP